MNATATKSPESSFRTYGEHIADGERGTLVMFERPSAEERALLVFPLTYCPNVADLLDVSNWEHIKSELGKVDPDGNDHQVASFGHWATPYDLMLVKADTEAYRVALELADSLESHPVLDEGDLSEREQQAFSDDLTSVLDGLTIVVNGIELGGESPEYDALFWAIDRELNENESQDNCDRSDVENVLRDLGFTYDESEFTWEGTLDIES